MSDHVQHVGVGDLVVEVPGDNDVRRRCLPGGDVVQVRTTPPGGGWSAELTLEPADTPEARLLARLPAVMETLEDRGVALEKVRGGGRTVAGLDGEEVALLVRQGASTHATCYWCGRTADGQRLVVQMSVDDPEEAQKLGRWDRLLDSAKHGARP